MILLIVFLFACALLIYVAFSWHFPKNYKAMKDFNGPAQIAVFGNALQIPSTMLELTELGMKWSRDFKSPVLVKIIHERLSNWNNDTLGRNEKKNRLPFLDLLLQSHKDGLMSMEDIQEEVDTFMFGGYETVACSLTWILYCLARNPEWQERVVKEIKEVLGELNILWDVPLLRTKSTKPNTKGEIYPVDVEHKHLHDLKYMEACIREAQRIYPAAPQVNQILEQPLVLDENHTVPAGVTVHVSFMALHQDPYRFPNPTKFVPERFLESSTVKKHPFEFLPFSAGPRNCIGQRFALMVMKVGLCHLLSSFALESDQSEEEMAPSIQFLLKPTNGLFLTFTPRQP